MIYKIKKFFYNIFFQLFFNKEEKLVKKLIEDLVKKNEYSELIINEIVKSHFDLNLATILANEKIKYNHHALLSKLLLLEKDINNLDLISLLSKKYFENVSFSQCGEDIIIKFLFDYKNIDKPSYIDIGAYDPFHYSNTALFYLNGSRGINIEPNPDNYKKFIGSRSEDVNLNVGISNKDGEMDYYFIDAPTLNTFSEQSAKDYINEGHKIIDKKKIKVLTIEDVLQHKSGKFPDFLSIDAEGQDELILKSINYSDNRPKVICVETLSYSRSGEGKKNKRFINYLESKNYVLFADTYINTIFVDRDFFYN